MSVILYRYNAPGLWFRSRRFGLETYQRLGRQMSRSRPFTSRAQDQLRTITIDTELTCTAMSPAH